MRREWMWVGIAVVSVALLASLTPRATEDKSGACSDPHDFAGLPASLALRHLAHDLQLHLLVHTEKSGVVSIDVRTRPARAAFEAICASLGWECRIASRVMVVNTLPAGRAEKPPPVVQHRRGVGCIVPDLLPVPLEHAPARQVALAVREGWPDARVTADAEHNFVVVDAPASQLRVIKQFTQYLDEHPDILKQAADPR